MTDIEWAVLKSLAIGPSPGISPVVQPIVIALSNAGYVTLGASGWMATELGCLALENKRSTGRW